MLLCCLYCRLEGKATEFRGAVVAHVHQRGKGYGSGRSDQLYRHLRELGVNSIQLNTFAYQPSHTSTTLRWDDPSLSDHDLIAEMDSIRKHGLQIFLKPHVWVGGRRPIVFRNGIDFEDPKELGLWFSSYRKFMLHQTDLAIKGRAEAFAVGTELVRLTKHQAHWRSLIRAIRARGYNGRLTYAAEAWNSGNIGFWDELDAIGLDFYYGFSGRSPAPAQLRAFYSDKLRLHYRQAAVFGKPVWLTEFGFPAHQDAVRRPHAWPDETSIASPQLQAHAFKIFGEALRETGRPQGLWLWKYVTELDSYESSNLDTGFILYGKPAERELPCFWECEQ